MTKIAIKNRYGVIPNSLLNDPALSFKAKGLYGYIQSKPDDWDFSVSRIQLDSKESKDSISSGIKELQDKGYLKRIKGHNSKGYWDTKYVLYAYPTQNKPVSGNPSSATPEINKERYTKKELIKKDKDILSKDNIQQSGKNLKKNFSSSETENSKTENTKEKNHCPKNLSSLHYDKSDNENEQILIDNTPSNCGRPPSSQNTSFDGQQNSKLETENVVDDLYRNNHLVTTTEISTTEQSQLGEQKERENLSNNVINQMIEIIKIYNNGMIDGTVKEIRRYCQHIINKLSKSESIVNGKFSLLELFEMIISLISNNKYHASKISSPKTIYYNLASLMMICKSEILSNNKDNGCVAFIC